MFTSLELQGQTVNSGEPKQFWGHLGDKKRVFGDGPEAVN